MKIIWSWNFYLHNQAETPPSTEQKTPSSVAEQVVAPILLCFCLKNAPILLCFYA